MSLSCKKPKNNAVTELIGTILLLGVAITIFSVVYVAFLTFDFEDNSPKADLIAAINDNQIIIEHWGEEPIDVNSSLFIDIAGQREPVGKISNYIDNHIIKPEEWNFGERIIYPLDINVSDLEVKANIADIHSNSLVVMSKLQEGYVVSVFGRGGIWHLNENANSTAFDSSGNNNHGIISYPNWTTGQNESAIFFDGFNTLINVSNHPSLDIYKNISMEAWVKPLEFNIIVSDQVLDSKQKFAYTPDVAHIIGDVYGVVSEEQSKGGILNTFNISEQGDIDIDSYNFSWEFGTGSAQMTLRPIIRQVINNIFVIAYVESKDQVVLKTVNISNNGSIQPTGYSLSLDSDCAEPYMEKINNTSFSLVYSRNVSGPNNDGIIRIINISNEGNIINTVNKVTYDNIDWMEPKLYHINNDLYGLTYSSSDGSDGYLTTVNITTNGDIDKSSKSVFTINSSGSHDPYLIHMNNGKCVILYGQDEFGYAKTLILYENGTIIDTLNELLIGNQNYYAIHGLKMSENMILLVSTTSKNEGSGNSQGYITSIVFNNDNSLEIGQPPYTFEEDKCFYPKVIRISENIYAVIYTVDKHDGRIKTFFSEPDIEYLFMRVVGKYGAYGFNLNTTNVYATINGERYSTTINHISSNDDWYHVVVTYDMYNVKAFVNLNLVLNETVSGAPKLIQKSSSPLLFGNHYYGTIDEIAVFDRILTLNEIQDHYYNPGSLDS